MYYRPRQLRASRECKYTQYNCREEIMQLYLKHKHSIDLFYNTVGSQTNFLSYDENEYIFEPSDFMIIAEMQDNITDCDDPKYIGIITITNGKKKKNRHIGTLGIVITMEYCNKGIGTILMNKVLNSYSQDSLHSRSRTVTKCKKIQLSVRTDNHIAVNLYKKLGFIVEGELKNDTCIQTATVSVQNTECKYYNTYIMAYYISFSL